MKQAISQMYRKRLNWLFGAADDEAFSQLVWAANLVQDNDPEVGLAYLRNVGREYVTKDIANKHFIYKWELETIVNELLRIGKHLRPASGKYRQLNCEEFRALAEVVNKLRKLENSEAGRWVRNDNILDEMPRIAARQFQWQQGWFNVPQFYRMAAIYGQGKCAEYFEAKNGLTINEFSITGFALISGFMARPIMRRGFDLPMLGLSAATAERGVQLLGLSIAEARAKRAKMGLRNAPIGHQPSVLRQYPCIIFGDAGERIRAPLPQLIVERITSGIFYDVIDGGGEVREEYGRRFEAYSLSLLQATLGGIRWEPEYIYKVKRSESKSPDILWLEDDGVRLAIECKATRQSFEARYADEPLQVRGYDELIKAVFQLWRYFSHCRRGISGVTVRGDAIGMVLTLDDWLTMANTLITDVLEGAEAIAAERDPEILAEDRRPIVFCSITDLERTLVKATEASFGATLDRVVAEKRTGWFVSNVHDEIVPRDEAPRRDYPFKDQMGTILPWWSEVEKAVAETKATLSP